MDFAFFTLFGLRIRTEDVQLCGICAQYLLFLFHGCLSSNGEIDNHDGNKFRIAVGAGSAFKPAWIWSAGLSADGGGVFLEGM